MDKPLTLTCVQVLFVHMGVIQACVCEEITRVEKTTDFFFTKGIINVCVLHLS